jgi:hypothetical protein
VAYILRVYIVDGGDRTIKVGHEFYGLTEKECDTYYREHLGSCDYFRSAEKEGRTIEEIEEVDRSELPSPDEFDDGEEVEEYEAS